LKLRLYEPFTLIIVGIGLLALIAGVADYYYERKGKDLFTDDSPVEELAESILEDATGVEFIDITPDSPEK